MGRLTVFGQIIPFFLLKRWILRHEQVFTGAVFETAGGWAQRAPIRNPVSYMVIDNGVYLVIDSKRMLEMKKQKLQSEINSIDERLACVAEEEDMYDD